MKQSKLITVPIKAQSSKKHPVVHLAYITDKEQDLLIKKDLYGSLKGKPNRGPGGLPSLEGDFGPGGKGDYEPAGPDVSSHTATGEGGQTYAPTPTTSSHHPGSGDKKVSASNVGIATSVIRKNPFGAVASWVGKKLFGPKVPPDQAGGASAKVIKMGGAKVSKKAISADRNRYTNLSHDQEDPGGEKHGPEGLMTTTLTTAPTADKSFGHQWDFKAYDNQQATTTPNVYDYSKAPYAKKGKLVRKYATGQEVKKRSLPPSKGPDSKGLPSILENSDYFTKLIGG
jgi:hypothetical protein